ncbi:MAG: oxidoreductase [Vulcanimicrobiaceae bacterium]
MAIRVALIGYGYSGSTFHAPLIRSVPGLELVAVGSRDAARVHADFPNARAIADPLEAATLANADLVVVATPNSTHAALATAAINAGKHVVVDKPFVLSLVEAERLAELAAAKRCVLSVFQNRRWDSDFLGAKAALAGGALGDVVHVESHFDRFRPDVRERWREQAVPGGGLLYDLGPHLIDQALQLFGIPRAVTALSAIQRANAQVEDWLHIVFDYGRLRVVLHASMLALGGARRFVVHGTEGSWIKVSEDVQERQLRSGMQPGDATWGVDPEAATLYSGTASTALTVPNGDYRTYYAGLRDAILGAGTNPVSPDEAVAVMRILELARASGSEGRTLTL